MYSKQAFTLIEIAIVMIIIGFIVGGVLVGRDLVDASIARSFIAKEIKFQTAINVFLGKYNCLPGDCSIASRYFPVDPLFTGGGHPATTSGTCDGDGNGLVNTSEAFVVANQLALAGYIEGAYYPAEFCTPCLTATSTIGLNIYPLNVKLSGGFEFYSSLGITSADAFVASSASNYHVIVAGQQPGSILFGQTFGGNGAGRLFSPKMASQIDIKVDDGFPYSGNIFGTWDIWTDSCGKSTSLTNAYLLNTDIVDQGWPSANIYGCVLYFNTHL